MARLRGNSATERARREVLSKYIPKTCVYCRRARAVTTDLVPPTAIYRPDTHRWGSQVPVCLQCQREALTNYAYLDNHLRAQPDVDNGANPATADLMFRLMNRPPNCEAVDAILFSKCFHELQADSTNRLGDKADTERSDPVLQAVILITLGFYYRWHEQILPLNCVVTLMTSEILERLEVDIRAKWHQDIIEILKPQAQWIIGENFFSCKFAFAADDPLVSAWAFTFFERTTFLAITGPAITPEST